MAVAALAVFATVVHADCRIPGARPVSNTVLAFKDRGNRCEGFYEAKVATTTGIELVSLARGAFPSDLKSAQTLSISSRSTKPLTVRAVPLRRAIYYMMEAVLPADQTLRWPATEVLARSYLSGTHLGVLGEIGTGTTSSFYVPVSINGATGSVNAIFRAGRPLTGIRWRSKTVSGGRCAAPGAWQTAVKTEDDGRIIRVTLPEQRSSCVEVIGNDGKQPVSASFRVETAP